MHKRSKLNLRLLLSLIIIFIQSSAMDEDEKLIKCVHKVSQSILHEALAKNQTLLHTLSYKVVNDRDNLMIVNADIVNFLLPSKIIKAIETNGAVEPLIDKFQESLGLINCAVGDIYRQIRSPFPIDEQEYNVLNNLGDALYNSSILLSSEQVKAYFKRTLNHSPQNIIKLLVVGQQLQDIYHKIAVGLKSNPKWQDQAESQLANFKRIDEVFLSFTQPYPTSKLIPENQPSNINSPKYPVKSAEIESSSVPKRALLKLRGFLVRN